MSMQRVMEAARQLGWHVDTRPPSWLERDTWTAALLTNWWASGMGAVSFLSATSSCLKVRRGLHELRMSCQGCGNAQSQVRAVL